MPRKSVYKKDVATQFTSQSTMNKPPKMPKINNQFSQKTPAFNNANVGNYNSARSSQYAQPFNNLSKPKPTKPNPSNPINMGKNPDVSGLSFLNNQGFQSNNVSNPFMTTNQFANTIDNAAYFQARGFQNANQTTNPNIFSTNVTNFAMPNAGILPQPTPDATIMPTPNMGIMPIQQQNAPMKPQLFVPSNFVSPNTLSQNETYMPNQPLIEEVSSTNDIALRPMKIPPRVKKVASKINKKNTSSKLKNSSWQPMFEGTGIQPKLPSTLSGIVRSNKYTYGD